MTDPTNVYILIVDDHPALAYGTKLFLESRPWIAVADTAATGAMAIDAVTALNPHVVIIDLHLPDMTGVHLIQELQTLSDAHIIIYTGDESWIQYFNELIGLHISGMVHKKHPIEFLEEAIKGALQGCAVIPLETFYDLRTTANDRPDAHLTIREIDILRLVDEGFTNQEIAQKLYLSPKTIENNLTRIYKKLGAESRFEAMKKFKSLDG